MINKNLRFLKYTGVTLSFALIVSLSSGCSSSIEIPNVTVSYGPEIGLADGNVDLSGDEPIINISDIKSPVGENIDFLSGVVIMNEDDFDDLQVWADASAIDIFTPGDYKAVYTFNYNGKTVSKEVTVTIFKPDDEPSASDTNATNEQNSSNNSEQQTTSHRGDSGSSSSNSTGNSSGGSSDGSSGGSSGNTTTASSSNESNSNNNDTTTKAPTTEKKTTDKQEPTATTKTPPRQTTTATKPTTNSNSSGNSETTSRREIITSTGDKTTINKHIGNYTIELLSGRTITIKNTTSKYIVSTRTDTYTKEKNGNTYKVSNLIITFNTGAEQILETVEERIK